MSAYNFKKQFVPLVRSGAKRSTIRQNRKRNPRPGEMLQLYTGMRTKRCEKIRPDAKCLSVTPLRIQDGKLFCGRRRVGGLPLSTLARIDGFNSVAEFFEFFRKQYGVGPFHGVLIEW